MMLYYLPCSVEVHVLPWTSFDHGYDLEREHFFGTGIWKRVSG